MQSQSIDIDIIITCMGRLRHLQQSLPSALAQENAHCIVVDYSCPDRCGDWVKDNAPEAQVVRIEGQKYFNRCVARNAGALAGDSPWLFFLDADVVIDSGFLSSAGANLSTDNFYTLAVPGHQPQAAVGNCIVARSVFEEIGGFDEVFQGWGREDYDLVLRLKRKGIKHHIIGDGLVTGVEHDQDARIEHQEIKDRNANWHINRLYGRAKLDLEFLQDRPMDLLHRQQLYNHSREVVTSALNQGSRDFHIPLERSTIANVEISRLLHYHVDTEPGRWQPGAPSSHPAFTSALTTIRERWPDLNSDASEEPLFLLAAGHRSGSTLLQRILSRERWIWGEPYRQSGLIDNLSTVFRCITEEWPRDKYLHGNPAQNHPWIANLYPDPQHLVNATLQYLQTLFVEPAKSQGFPLWGIKDVTLDSDMASFLKWLYPRGRFIFLIRNPYFAYRSYRRFQQVWYVRWPDQALDSPEEFGKLWLRLAQGFMSTAEELGAMVLRYEEIISPDFDWTPVEQHVGHPVDRTQLEVRATGHGSDAVAVDPATLNQELFRLSNVVHTFASSIGYWLPNPSEIRE